MSVWGIALISACSALAGSMITGWFARSAGARQAEAARYAGIRQADALLAAGSRQADALLETVRMSLAEQLAERVLDSRRQTYLSFAAAMDAVIGAKRTGEGPRDGRATLQRAFGAVELEGPAETVQRAGYVLECLRDGTSHSPDDLERARQQFIDAARNVLVPTQLPPWATGSDQH